MKLIIPIQNPTRFYQYRKEPDPKYRSRLLRDYKYIHTVLPWQQEVKWAQPWQLTDEIKVQLMADIECELRVYNSDGALISTTPFEQQVTEWKIDGTEVYEASATISVEGFYYFCIATEGEIIAITECQEFREEWPESLLIEYKHRKNFEDVAFDTGIEFAVRVPAVLTDFKFGSEDVMYLDQQRDQTVLDTKSWGVYTLILGDQFGVPDYFAEIINKVISLSNVKIDGVYYAKNEAGAKLERTGDALYSRAGWRIDLTEKDYAESYTGENFYQIYAEEYEAEYE